MISQERTTGRDSSIEPAQYLLQELQWWQRHVHLANGWYWHQHRVSVTMASDASESRYVAYQVDALPGQPWRMEVGFSEEEQAQMAANRLHSTMRELRAIRQAVLALTRQRGESLPHITIQWFSDSQAGVVLLRAMKGAARCLQEIRLVSGSHA